MPANTVESLAATIDRLEKSAVTDARKESVIAVLQEKQEEAQKAANIAFSLHLEATVGSGTDLEKPAPLFKDALTVVSPGQTFQVMARLHNMSGHWLLVKNAEVEGGRDWIRQTDAGGEGERGIAVQRSDLTAQLLQQVATAQGHPRVRR